MANTIINIPTYFARQFDKNYQVPRHIKLIEKSLLRIVNGSCKRLILTLPPRHGKSEFTSKYFPAWYLANFPSKKIILASYEANFAASWGRQIRDLLRELNLIRSDVSATNHFETIEGGVVNTAGVGGAITGKGADLLIIDDPVKDADSANSDTLRKKTLNWFQSTAYTRLEPDGAIIIIMTRWHEDDLVGALLKLPDEANKWDIIDIPAIAEHNDILGREEGEALWPERYSIDKLLEIKNIIGSYWFNSLFQQKPASEGSGLFKRKNFMFYRKDHDTLILHSDTGDVYVNQFDMYRFATMDLAISMKETSDYTVIGIFGLTRTKDLILLDLIRDRIEPVEHLNLLKSIPRIYAVNLIGVESTQYQVSLVQNALKEGLPVKELKAESDKKIRALLVATKFENHKVYLPENATFLQDLMTELLSFPVGKHDDIVDVFAYTHQMVDLFNHATPLPTSHESVNRFTQTKKISTY